MSDSHSHAHEPMQLEADRPKSGIIGVMVVVTILLVVGICVAVNEYFKVVLESELQTKVYSLVDSRLPELRAEEDQKLNHYQWVDSKHEAVRIPLARARELTLADYKAAAAASAEAVAPAASAAPVATAPAAPAAPAPAASAVPSTKEHQHP
jgi:hypothetical protein